MKTANLKEAYEGSHFTILGAGGDPEDWMNGYNTMLEAEGIGTPTEWFQTTGGAINNYAATKGYVADPFNEGLTILTFPLDGLNVGKLALFKLGMGHRWFDDIIDNMVDLDPYNEAEDEEDWED